MRAKYLGAWLSSAATLALPGVAAAQVNAPPVRETVDANGVDLIRGALNASATDLSIGPSGSHGLTYSRYWESNGWRDSLSSGISNSTQNPVVTVNGVSDSFTLGAGGAYTPDQGNGASLTVSGGTYTYTSRTGVVAQFADASSFGQNPRAASNVGWIISLTYPDGNVLTFNYKTETINWGTFSSQEVRLRSVTNSFGYMLHLDYAASSLSDATAFTWSQVSAVTAINTQVEACSPSADTCSMSGSWPQVTYAYPSSSSLTPPTNAVTDPTGRTTQYTYDGSGALTAMRRPGASVDDVSVSYNGAGQVQTVTRAGSSWSYTYDYNSTAQRQTVTTSNPNGTHRTFVADTSIAEPFSSTDEVGALTGYLFNVQGHLAQISYPDGNLVSYGYDGRGNVTSVTQTPKPNQNLGATIVTTAYFDPGCSNMKICNQPIWTRDANNAQTDYSYDPGSGLPAVVTQPAGANGVRPQQRYSYTVANGVTLLTSASACRTTASCFGTGDEVKTTIGYGQNLLATSVTKASGDGSLVATTTMTYDAVGDTASVDGPLPGPDDTVYLRYDAARRQVGTISPDPDGSGALKRRAVRTSYGADGQASQVEAGTVNGTSDAEWSAFATLQQISISFDTYGRKIEDAEVAGSTIYAVTDYGYDGMGRLQCTAVRMNLATSTNGTGACTLAAQGSDGPDRITFYDYDAANRVRRVTQGYGTAQQADVARTTYTLNGNVATATDANGNMTSYAYEGFDRLWRVYYPGVATGSGQSNGADYVEYSYDSNGNITDQKLRDGQHIGYTYDPLGRLTVETRPGNVYWQTSLSYSWDNLGALTGANDGNNHALGFAHDSLGRLTGQSDNWYAAGNATFQFDAAGRRIRQTWWDGQYVAFSYDLLGEMTGVTEPSGYVPLSFGYDDLGRRTVLNRANGTSTSYGYDGASRLTALTHNGPTLTWGYSYNAAGQITSRTRNNDAYAWTGTVTTDRAYAANGLNQYTSSGATALGYDGRGNLTSSGSSSYTYTVDNQLATTPATGLAYDALGRLFNGVIDAGVNTTLSYDGDRVLAETNQQNGAVLRRYVFGPGQDEPLIWYEGSDLSNRRYLHADERGSVVSVTDNSGAVVGMNSYDEYGIPGNNNIGRFQYTGQKWLPTVGMYDYKARVYSPTLGRFMQSDPIGYAGGMNWYNYTGGDPVNKTDARGTLSEWDCYGNCGGGYANSFLVDSFGVHSETYVTNSDGSLTFVGARDDFYNVYASQPFPSFGPGGIAYGLIAPIGGRGDLGSLDLGDRTSGKAASPQNLLQRVTSLLCSAPSVAGGGGLDAYAGVGGSVSGAISFNPRNGQISIGFDTGVGVGVGGGGRIAGGKFAGIGKGSSENLPIAGGGVNVNGTAVAGPAGITGSYQLIGSNRGDFGLAATGGAEISANVNVSAHGQFNLPSLYNLGCK